MVNIDSFNRSKSIEELKSLQIPRHVGIIMDGNGRWALERNMPRTFGHKAGVERIRSVLEYSNDLAVEIVSVYAFSSENWSRPKWEVNALMQLLIDFMKNEIDELNAKNVKIRFIGDYLNMPKSVIKALDFAREKTELNTGLVFNIALNYGGRNEIVNACKLIALDCINKELDISEIDNDLFSYKLDTFPLVDPDVIIRTSGEKRLSNFLIWQSAYSELIFIDEHWPDFDDEKYYAALKEYTSRERRFGGL